MKIRWNRLLRQFHLWGTLVISIPIIIVITTGILQQLKSENGWLPPTVKGEGKEPHLSFDEILEAAKQAPEAGIADWGDVSRLQVKNGKGVTKVQAKNGWEVQVDHQTGEILQVAYRWIQVVEDLHDGSFFGDKVKVWVYLPSAVILLITWITGLYMIILPYWAKWRSAKKKQRRAAVIA